VRWLTESPNPEVAARAVSEAIAAALEGAGGAAQD